MSRDINWDEPLSDFDRQYAIDRGLRDKVEENERKHGKDASKDGIQRRRDRIVQLREELEKLEGEDALATQRQAVVIGPDPANPQVVGTPPVRGVRDNTPVDGVAPEGAPQPEGDDYDDEKKWTVAALKAEIQRLNDTGEFEMKTTGTRSELVERLRWANAQS